MPITKKILLYTFDELSDAAKEKARQWWRDAENEDFHTDFLYEDFQNMGRILGIEFDTRPVKLMGGGTRYDPTIYYSGFCNQGDGACFEGRYRYAKGAVKAIKKETDDKVLIDIAEQLQAAQRPYFYKLNATAKHRGHYYHSGCMDVDVEHDDDSYRTVSCDGIREALRSFADWMYRQLNAEYDYRMSDENVDDSIRSNEYTFTESGRRED